MEDSQAAARSRQSPGTWAQLRPDASCLLCSTQALSGQKSCTINPVLMWPGVVTALPVTAGTACLQRPGLLRWVVFLKAVVLHQMGHTVSLCLPLPCRHFVVPSVPLPGVICSFRRGCDGPECFPEHVTESRAVQTLKSCSASLCRCTPGLFCQLR